MFVGRKEELNYLEEKYQSSHAEFLVLYGRRRIGKTELLREFSKDKRRIRGRSPKLHGLSEKDPMAEPFVC